MVSGMTDVRTNDLSMAMSIAIGAVIVGSFLPWAQMVLGRVNGTDGNGNLTLLLGGIAGALLVRWRFERGARRGFMTASLVSCSAAAVVALYDFTRVLHAAAQPQTGLFLAMTGAVTAAALAAALRQTPHVIAA